MANIRKQDEDILQTKEKHNRVRTLFNTSIVFSQQGKGMSDSFTCEICTKVHPKIKNLGTILGEINNKNALVNQQYGGVQY